MAKVLVTGALGFIGSHLCEGLVKEGYEVIGIDNLFGGSWDNAVEGVTYFEQDITDTEGIDKLFKDFEFAIVYHLAAYAAEGLSPFIRKFNYENNVIGSINLINASVNNKVNHFLFTSSMAVYGEQDMYESNQCLPIDPYGIAKLAVEQDLKAAHDEFNLHYTIFRPHNVYGERQNLSDKYRNVVGIFMRNKLEGEPAPIFGDGNQIRSFTYVKDIVPVMIEALTDTYLWDDTFNIGSDKPYSINELVDLLHMDKKYIGARREVKHTNPNHSHIRSIVGKIKETPLEEGLAKMWAWVQGLKDIQKPEEFKHIEITKNLPEAWEK